jgi:hypothetical protein
MEFLGVLVLKRKAWIGKGLKGRGLGERLGAPEVLIYGIGEEIVAGDRDAYPKKLGKWRDSLDRTVAGSFGIHIRFDWLRSSCVAVGLFFGSDTVWSELLNESFRNCSSNKARQIWKNKD